MALSLDPNRCLVNVRLWSNGRSGANSAAGTVIILRSLLDSSSLGASRTVGSIIWSRSSSCHWNRWITTRKLDAAVVTITCEKETAGLGRCDASIQCAFRALAATSNSIAVAAQTLAHSAFAQFERSLQGSNGPVIVTNLNAQGSAIVQSMGINVVGWRRREGRRRHGGIFITVCCSIRIAHVVIVMFGRKVS